jgi:hypothetical protein
MFDLKQTFYDLYNIKYHFTICECTITLGKIFGLLKEIFIYFYKV